MSACYSDSKLKPNLIYKVSHCKLSEEDLFSIATVEGHEDVTAQQAADLTSLS